MAEPVRRAFVTGTAPAAGSVPTSPRRGPPSIDEPAAWGKHRALTWRQIAAAHPFYAFGVARKVPGLRGRLAAEALAIHLGVIE